MLGLAVADRLDEVLEDISLAPLGQGALDAVEVIALGGLLGGLLVEVDVVGDAHVALAGQAAHVEDEKGFAVVENGELGIGRLSLVLVPEATPYADHALGPAGARDHPPRDVHLVDALVADVPVAVFPEPVPVVVNQVLVVLLLLGGSRPDVEIELGGGILGILEANGTATLVAGAEGYLELTVLSCGYVAGQVGPPLAGSVLGAVLDDAPVFLGGFDQLASLEDIVAERLLDVDVLAGLAGPDRHQAMPVVGGGDGDDVHFLVVQDAADVLNAFGGVLELAFDELPSSTVQALVKAPKAEEARADWRMKDLLL